MKPQMFLILYISNPKKLHQCLSVQLVYVLFSAVSAIEFTIQHKNIFLVAYILTCSSSQLRHKIIKNFVRNKFGGRVALTKIISALWLNIKTQL